MAERPRWGQGVGSRGCQKEVVSLGIQGQTLWASERGQLEVIASSPCPWAHRD